MWAIFRNGAMVFNVIDVCHSYASSHNIIFNCQKTLGLSFVSSTFKLNIKPNVVLGDFKIRFVNEIKYLRILLNSKLRDDNDINRQVCYLYGTANRLKHVSISVRRK